LEEVRVGQPKPQFFPQPQWLPDLICFFFFSSRRRHTRWPRDWSSDVCSSDLSYGEATVAYTSLTRAIEDLLCVLTPAEWSVVRGRWAGLGVSVEELDGAPASVVRLEELFRGLAGATDAAEQALVEEEKLAGLLDRLPS